MYRRLACDVPANPTYVAAVPASLQSRLEKGAVTDDKAEDNDCQCRSWPDHWAVIDPLAGERHPCNEVCFGSPHLPSTAEADSGQAAKILGART